MGVLAQRSRRLGRRPERTHRGRNGSPGRVRRPPLFAGPPVKLEVEREAVSHGDPNFQVEAQSSVVGGQSSGEPLLEVLYWVGCLGSFDVRNQRIAQALAGILQEAGVKFAILGK